MRHDAAGLGARLVVVQLGVHFVTFLLSGLFAPRMLLLEGTAARASIVVVASLGGVTAALDRKSVV